MIAYSIIIFFVYFGLLIYIIPSSGLAFDLYERKFRLLPYWFKIVALIWFVLAVVLTLLFKDSIPKWEELLFSNLNFSLFVSFFSKQKYEDEFSEQIRFKAFTYSFIGFVAMIGALGAFYIADSDSSNWSNFLVQGFMGGGLLVATLNFYFTLYKAKKENN